ncbi:ABC transporter substrate-binding protein [Romeria aff. gracilis LEGE 07310]|uniref:ABC transporter substrate-binding protein n=1 Tax=Vasconcelosia minhoensis LEGE 07310 TaxID=915328 RepID=A0A8J7AVK2_9CYAN|nr:ABC transporter substrate-binding protein [Romeria gracilis]MBE9077778.1 ABC transporter substrate-binding protein [Romeria aff. gracilis LEGE 07310]
MSMFNRRQFIQYGALAAGSGAIAACSGSQTAPSSDSSSSPEVIVKKEKVVASWLPIMQTTAYYVALKEGLFEQADIEIESVKFENPNQIIDSLVSSRADFGPPGAAAGITVLAEAKAPGTFKVYGLQGGGIKSGFINDGLIVKPDSSIQSFKDLKGLKVGTIPGVQWETILTYILHKNGLEPGSDVTIEQMAVGLQLPSVVSGAVNATLSLEPVGSIAEATQQAKRAMTNPVAMFIADPFYSGAAVLTTKFLQDRPETAAKVVQVIDEATRLANQNFDQYRPVISEYTALKSEQASYVAQPRLRSFSELDSTDIDSYQKFVDVFYEEGVLDQQMDVTEIMLDKSELA